MNTNLDKNKSIAAMLGWQYLPNYEVQNNPKYKIHYPGWYSVIPEDFNFKYHASTIYKGRNHRCLKFDTDWNKLIEAIEFIEKIILEEQQEDVMINGCSCFLPNWKDFDKISIVENTKLKAVFEAVSIFAEQFNTLNNGRNL